MLITNFLIVQVKKYTFKLYSTLSLKEKQNILKKNTQLFFCLGLEVSILSGIHETF